MDCLNSSLSSRVSHAWNLLVDMALFATLSLSQNDLAPVPAQVCLAPLAAVRSLPPKYQMAAKMKIPRPCHRIPTEVWGGPPYLHYQQPR